MLKREHEMALVVSLLVLAVLAFAGSAQAASALEDGQKIEEVSTPFLMISMTPGISTYLSDPKTVCTVFAPDNDAFTRSTEKLGPHVGQLTQNETWSQLIFDYAVIPGKALKLDEIKEGTYMTRAKEPLYVMKHKGKTYIFSNPEYPVLVKKSNLKAGKCLVHIVDETVPPPSTADQMVAWYKEYIKANPEEAAKDADPPEVVAAAKAALAKYTSVPSALNATAAAANKTATGAAAAGAKGVEEPPQGSGVVLPSGASSSPAPSTAAVPSASPAPSSAQAALNPATVIATTAVAAVAGFVGLIL